MTPGTGIAGPITAALMAQDYDPSLAHWLPWRVGEKCGRTVYAQVGAEPSADDHMVGVMDSVILATEVVAAHNLVLDQCQRGSES